MKKFLIIVCIPLMMACEGIDSDKVIEESKRDAQKIEEEAIKTDRSESRGFYLADFLTENKEKPLSELRQMKAESIYQESFLSYLEGRSLFFVEEEVNEGIEILTQCSQDYLNPLCSGQLASIYFNGPDENQIGFEQDFTLAKYYITMAFETTAYYENDSNLKDWNYMLNLVVSQGLGLLDSFNVSEIDSQVDDEMFNQLLEDSDWETRFNELYL